MNSVSLAHVIHLAQRRLVAVPAELGGCIVLAVADQLITNAAQVRTDQVFLFEDGSLRISDAKPTDEGSAEVSMRHLLDSLLATATAAPPALLRAARRQSGNDLAAFARELEVALVPTNRGAAKRALARLCREATRTLASNPELVASDDERAPVRELSHESPVASVPIVVESLPPMTVAEIPDLELPKAKVHTVQQLPEATNEAQPSATPGMDALRCEMVELCDADLESVQCPEVCLDEAPVPQENPGCVVDDTAPKEVTAPFPLTRIAHEQHIPAAPAAAAPEPVKKTSRLRFRPVFRAIQVDPDLTVPVLARPGESSPDSRQSGERSESTSSGESNGPEPSLDHVDPARHRVECAATRVAEPKPLTGPHQFVAPARFAKKNSKVTERVSQFARENQTAPTDLVDGLEKLTSCDVGQQVLPRTCQGGKETCTGDSGSIPGSSQRHVG